MLRKIFGLAVVVLGTLATSLSTYAFVRAAPMAALTEGAGVDQALWMAHWQFSTALYAGLGVLLLIGGVLILARFSSGMLVAAVAILLSGLIPWITSAIGYSRFAFEAPTVVETTILVGLSGFLVLLFLRRERWDQSATPNKSLERTREG